MQNRNWLVQQIKSFPWVFLSAVLLVRVGVAEANWVPTGSMQPTLPIGDYLVINKTAYGVSLPFVDKSPIQWDTPKRGDIVTFDPQHTEDRLIKRVIGVAGDTIEVRNGLTFLNGKRLALQQRGGFIEEALGEQHYLTTPAYPTHFGPVTVPEGHLFMMGDNRSNSADSRFWGFLPVERVRGKAVMRLFTTAWLSGEDFGASFGSLYPN